MTSTGPRVDLEARLQFALAEVQRLGIPDDHGSGERTSRLAGLASWEFEVQRLRALIESERGVPEGGGGRDAG